MIKASLNILIIATVVFNTGCKKIYAPAIVSTNNNFLVVEGFINTGNDSTRIKLSRSTKLIDTVQTRPELKATVFIEDEKNNKYILVDYGNGLYKCPPLSLSNVQRYRLHIITKAQKEYVSDYVEAYNTPPIDSLNYSVLPTGIQFYTSTHDPLNKTIYYRWDFDETWEYISFMLSTVIYENDTVRYRDPFKEDISRCWTNTHSNAIVLASTAALSNSVILNQPIAYVDILTNKLKMGYSMLLHQYALSKDAYEYWQKLKKNTQQLGSIFDAQPSDLKGNLHSLSDATESVLGFISASTVADKRVFIDIQKINLYQKEEFPTHAHYFSPPFPDFCGGRFIAIEPKETLKARLRNTLIHGDTILTEAIESDVTHQIVGWGSGPVECIDCRRKMSIGTNNRPSYWPPGL